MVYSTLSHYCSGHVEVFHRHHIDSAFDVLVLVCNPAREESKNKVESIPVSRQDVLYLTIKDVSFIYPFQVVSQGDRLYRMSS